MSDFAIKNLKDVEDSAADRGPDIEARFARRHLDADHLGVSYFRYAPGYPDRAARPKRRSAAARGFRRDKAPRRDFFVSCCPSR